MTILIPTAQIDFDPSEVAIPWKLLTRAGLEVRFASPTGRPAEADFRMLTGEGLGPFAPFLKARADAVALYREMSSSQAFQKPLRYDEAREEDFQALLLPGGHAPGMREYLESEVLQRLVARFFVRRKPVAAVCHGVLLAARSRSPETGRSVLYGRKTTGLLKQQELLAWALTWLWRRNYYRTYPTPLQDEVTSLLEKPTDFLPGPSPLFRDTEQRPGLGFVVRDDHYLSARWPGDAYRLGLTFLEMLAGR